MGGEHHICIEDPIYVEENDGLLHLLCFGESGVGFEGEGLRDGGMRDEGDEGLFVVVL